MAHNNCHKHFAAIILACGLVATRAASWNMGQDLPRQLTDISNRLAASGSLKSRQAIADDLQNINYEISQAILSTESVDWGAPSPDRRAIIEQAGNLIEPFNLLLVEMAFDEKKSGSDRVSRQCLSLLDYTSPDALFQDAVKQQARANPGTILEPYRLLYEHHALEDSMRELASAQIREEPNPKKKISMALASAEMGFDDAIPICEQLLSKPFTTEGMTESKGVFGETELTSGYRRAADALLYLGPKAGTLLPLLIQRRDEIVRALGPEASRIFIGSLEGAIDCLEGRRPPNAPTAVNGSGSLDTITNRPAAQSSLEPFIGKPSHRPAASQNRRPSQSSFVVSAAEQLRPSSRLPWVIVQIILLILGIIVLFRKTATGP